MSGGQTSPHSPRLIVSHRSCPPLSSSICSLYPIDHVLHYPHSYPQGPGVINNNKPEGANARSEESRGGDEGAYARDCTEMGIWVHQHRRRDTRSVEIGQRGLYLPAPASKKLIQGVLGGSHLCAPAPKEQMQGVRGTVVCPHQRRRRDARANDDPLRGLLSRGSL